MSNLIEGYNPTTISRITMNKFWRNGWHPMYYRLQRKRFGLLSIFMWGPDDWDGVHLPTVIIRGGDDRILTRIECKSNREASAKRNELRRELESFLRRATAVGHCKLEKTQ